MSRVAVFDCFAGISGDMALGALLDAGAPLKAVREAVGALGLPGVRIEPRRVRRGGIEGVLVEIEADERQLDAEEMRALLRTAPLSARMRERALAAVDALANAEERVHGGAARFHEVGGVDTLVDVVGVAAALEALKVERCLCPVVTVGAGAVAQAAHGPLPASPPPAAYELLRSAGFALRFTATEAELVTPTGAAILAAMAEPGDAVIRPQTAGFGAGRRDLADRPNALRAVIGELVSAELRQLLLVEANVDDQSPEELAYACELLLAHGAFDAWLEPIAMKKGRLGSKLCALVAAGEEARVVDLILRETTTLGVRLARYERVEAERWTESVETPFGPVRVKFARWEGRTHAKPEFEDVRAIARRLGAPYREVAARIRLELERRAGSQEE